MGKTFKLPRQIIVGHEWCGFGTGGDSAVVRVTGPPACDNSERISFMRIKVPVLEGTISQGLARACYIPDGDMLIQPRLNQVLSIPEEEFRARFRPLDDPEAELPAPEAELEPGAGWYTHYENGSYYCVHSDPAIPWIGPFATHDAAWNVAVHRNVAVARESGTEERATISIFGEGGEADGAVELTLSYPYVGDFAEPVANALDAAKQAGMLHEAIERLTINVELRG